MPSEKKLEKGVKKGAKSPKKGVKLSLLGIFFSFIIFMKFGFQTEI